MIWPSLRLLFVISNDVNLLNNILFCISLTLRAYLLVVFDVLFRSELLFFYSLSNRQVLVFDTMEWSRVSFRVIFLLIDNIALVMFLLMRISIVSSLSGHLIYLLLKSFLLFISFYVFIVFVLTIVILYLLVCLGSVLL